MAYLFVHFTGEEPDGEQIYFSVSRDGLHWIDLGGGPALRSDVGERGVRDPFVVRDRVDGKFHIIATDLRIAAGKGWGAAQYEGSTSLIAWESDDLVRWSSARMIGLEEMRRINAGCVWAPEAIFDGTEGRYLVYWASMVDKKQRIYAAWTEDFRVYSGVHPHIEKEKHIIDTTMAEENGVFYRFSACGECAGIMMEKGPAPDADDYVLCCGEGIPGTERTEGPIIIYLREMGKWCLYVDDIGRNAGYVPFLADSLAEGAFVRAGEGEYSLGRRRKRHGSILEITEEECGRMLSHYGVSAQIPGNAGASAGL